NLNGEQHLITIAEDITERQRMEQEARQRQKELTHVARLSSIGEMASELAHELNQPLTAITTSADGSLRMLESGSPDTDIIIKAIRNASKQANRAGDIIRRIRDFSRKREPKKSQVNINEVVQEALSFIKHEAQEHNIDIKLDLSKQIHTIEVDEVLILQVVLNLLRNGLEAMYESDNDHPCLTIETRQSDDNNVVEVSVQDTGIGIKPDDTEQLFDSFFTTKKSGLGIGLSISRSIIESHRGKLWAENNDHSGATFRFTLPIILQEGGSNINEELITQEEI
ncbi:MAG: GHKL domain-containing protein, partial [bacterium]|nr:GHKL domain-containing protein [bacterium]